MPDVLLVLVALLLPELSDFVLQLDNGPLDLIVLTDQRHPAVEGQMLRSQQKRNIFLKEGDIKTP